MENKHYAWQDGLPTGPDVTLIRAKWPNLKAGDSIPYDEVAALIGVKVNSVRFRSVTNAWRTREQEDGRVIKCEKKIAFYVATAEQITSSTYDALRHIGRSAKKQRKHLGTIHAADQHTKGIVDHQARLMHAVEKDARVKRMNILPSTKPSSPPQIEPPRSMSA